MASKKSILTDCMDYCYICGFPYPEKHHVLYGKNHKMADKYKLLLPLCYVHHRDQRLGVHFNKKLDDQLKRMAQETFERIYSHEKWMEVFQENYL